MLEDRLYPEEKFAIGGPPAYTANPRITRLIRSEKSSRNTKTRKVNN